MAEVNLEHLQRMLDYMSELARGLAQELHNADADAAKAYAEKLEGVARNPPNADVGKHANYVASILREGKKPHE